MLQMMKTIKWHVLLITAILLGCLMASCCGCHTTEKLAISATSDFSSVSHDTSVSVTYELQRSY
jgi:hypothetical protein